MKHTNPPKISVLLPVYNAEKYLSDCLKSLLNQTFHDFEIIIINDASTDSSLNILHKYSEIDSRIKIFNNKSNLKLAATLNRGIQLASAPLIARMDADDISSPRRLEFQYNFMLNNPKVDICGTNIKVIGTNQIWKIPISNNSIRAALVFNSPILHPTVVYRKHIICKHNGYNENIIYAQDYELWHRLSKDNKVCFENIDIPLVYYRITDDDKPASYKKIQKNIADIIREEQIKMLGITPSGKQLALHSKISLLQDFNTLPQLFVAYRWLRFLASSPKTSQALKSLCWQYWKQICKSSSCKYISYPLYTLLPSSNEKTRIIRKKIFLAFSKRISND